MGGAEKHRVRYPGVAGGTALCLGEEWRDWRVLPRKLLITLTRTAMPGAGPRNL